MHCVYDLGTATLKHQRGFHSAQNLLDLFGLVCSSRLFMHETPTLELKSRRYHCAPQHSPQLSLAQCSSKQLQTQRNSERNDKRNERKAKNHHYGEEFL